MVTGRELELNLTHHRMGLGMEMLQAVRSNLESNATFEQHNSVLFYCKFLAESKGERILKIGKHLAKL